MIVGSAASDRAEPSCPIVGLTAANLPSALETLGPLARGYAGACSFKAEPGEILLVPDAEGRLAVVLFGLEAPDRRRRDRFQPGRIASLLPPGRYRLTDGFDGAEAALSCLAIELGSYRFDSYRKPRGGEVTIEAPRGVDADRLALVAQAVAFGRDLINRPANDLSPAALEAAVANLAERYGGRFEAIRGHDLLERNLPMIHAVGRAAAEEPRLAQFVWGDKAAPTVTLVGKGVCFDTGGLDIKPEAAMALMKKDMGGAACALSLAAMLMGADLPLRLRVIVPIVENAISANAFRPGDILTSRSGLTVEVGNTDAEGRLILADALALAGEDDPELLLDFATLTGAARVALGPDLPPFYTDDEDLAAAIARHALAVHDPLWRMPLWDPYDSLLNGKVAEVSNVSGGPFAGSVTAALFLRRFVKPGRSWAHFDVYGWNPTAKPGRPEGGEIQAARALFDLLLHRYGGATGGGR